MDTQYAMPLDTHRAQNNHLLAALSPESMARLGPHLKFVDLAQGKVLCESEAKMHYVYFPTDAIISLQSVMHDGAAAEISVIGNEGVLGVSLFMGGETSPTRAVVQGAGGAFCVPRRVMMEEFDRHGKFMKVLLHYTQALITQTAQIVVCNRYHSIDQQLCRRLLMGLDRIPGNLLLMTQEMIANMLGVRREGVTEAAGKLQKLGAIVYSRGKIEVLDRTILESRCCECYAVVKKETDRLLAHSSAM